MTFYFGNQTCDTNPKFSLQRPVKHEITGLPTGKKDLKYIVFSDPQLGLYDAVIGNDGTNWEHDLENIQKFGEHVKQIQPDFIFCAGDLNNAYPDDDAKYTGFKAAYRPAQTVDLWESLKQALPGDIPLFVIAGNHDKGVK